MHNPDASPRLPTQCTKLALEVLQIFCGCVLSCLCFFLSFTFVFVYSGHRISVEPLCCSSRTKRLRLRGFTEAQRRRRRRMQAERIGNDDVKSTCRYAAEH